MYSVFDQHAIEVFKRVWELILLAVIQGVAEFLPISSSGHLVIVGALIGLTEESATVNIVLHAGTLASILTVYRKQILNLLTSDRRVFPLLVIGTIPAGVAGLIIKAKYKSLLENPLLAGWMLLVTGALLLILRRLPSGDNQYQSLPSSRALGIGVFQAFALLPGISRSGSTIFGGRMLGLSRDDALTFSFLLAIPAILGATVLEAKDLIEAQTPIDRLTGLGISALVAYGVGIFSLRWLIAWNRRDQIHLFAYWCIPVGLITILWQIAQ